MSEQTTTTVATDIKAQIELLTKVHKRKTFLFYDNENEIILEAIKSLETLAFTYNSHQNCYIVAMPHAEYKDYFKFKEFQQFTK